MASRPVLTTAAVAVAILSIVKVSAGPSQRRGSRVVPERAFSSSVGPVSASVIAAWRAHGAENGEGVRVEQQPATIFERAWILDLLVLWRWQGRAPDMAEGGGGDSGPGIRFVPYRVAVQGRRDLRVEHDIQTDTVRIDDATKAVRLAGANVLMLDVDEREVRVAGMAAIPRFEIPDAVEAAKAASADVAAFVGSW